VNSSFNGRNWQELESLRGESFGDVMSERWNTL
jgi:hypothetical protein